MMYDIPDVLSPHRIFNYMCLYGNVRRIQFFDKPSLACLGISLTGSFQMLVTIF